MAPQSRIILALATIVLTSALATEVRAFSPLVKTGPSQLSPEGKHVAVHVPAFFRMILDTRGIGKGLRMDQSVMSGLVKIMIDRERQADGSLHGPIRVKVGGVTMYDNGEPNLSSSAELESSYNANEQGYTQLPDDTSGISDQLNQQASQFGGRLNSVFTRSNSQGRSQVTANV